MGYVLNYENGISNVGSLERLKRVMDRAKNGGRLTIGFLGGSITQGSLATAPELCYAHRVYEWWCRTFPQTEFTYVNAGIGGTTSQFGAARADSDLLSYEPDFVIVEFSVNDDSTEHFMETYEGLVRKIYNSATKPAVLLVHNVFYNNGANAQLMHGRVARHYHLPAVSMQSTLYQEVVSGRIENRAITPDDLHPNDEGHRLVASVITYFMDKVRAGELASAEAEITELPTPLTANTYEHSTRYRNNNSTPRLDGFVADEKPQNHITDCFKLGWTASEKGAGIVFDVPGSNIAVQYRKSVKLPAPVAEIIVDDDADHAMRLDANFDETWGDKLELDTVLEHGENKKHKVEIRLVETHPDDAVPFYLVSVIGAE
ncbi:MAG: SGNH/GDSL hydrolase family protein [Roseburia sp.]